MGVIINPFTGDFDFTGNSSSAPAIRYTAPFNQTTDWGSPVGGQYTITISQATHGKTTHPSVFVYETISGVNHKLEVNDIAVDSLGNVSVSVLSSPDLRFAGLIVII